MLTSPATCSQLAVSPLDLLGNLYLLVGHQIVEQGLDQRGQADAVLLDRDRLGDEDLLLLRELLLKPTQHQRLATADHATDGDQATFDDRPSHVLHQFLMMGGFVVARLVQRLDQAVIVHHLNPHVPSPSCV